MNISTHMRRDWSHSCVDWCRGERDIAHTVHSTHSLVNRRGWLVGWQKSVGGGKSAVTMANNSVVLWIARLVDVDPAGVIFLLTLLATYPLSLLYLTVFRTRSTRAKSLYLAGSGIALATAAYGINVFHSLVNCCFCYLVTRWLAPRIAIVLTLVTTMVYLLVGYRLNQVDWTYSITWTIPQCILTLRLIAFSFDIYDGQNKQKKSDVSIFCVYINSHFYQFIRKKDNTLDFFGMESYWLIYYSLMN